MSDNHSGMVSDGFPSFIQQIFIECLLNVCQVPKFWDIAVSVYIRVTQSEQGSINHSYFPFHLAKAVYITQVN